MNRHFGVAWLQTKRTSTFLNQVSKQIILSIKSLMPLTSLNLSFYPSLLILPKLVFLYNKTWKWRKTLQNHPINKCLRRWDPIDKIVCKLNWEWVYGELFKLFKLFFMCLWFFYILILKWIKNYYFNIFLNKKYFKKYNTDYRHVIQGVIEVFPKSLHSAQRKTKTQNKRGNLKRMLAEEK
jgi:hypothetical protein